MNKAYFLVLPQVHMLDLAGPMQVMGTLAELGIAGVDIECIGPQPQVRSFQGVVLEHVAPLPRRLDPQDVVFVIGSKLGAEAMAAPPWRAAAAWLREQVASMDTPPTVAGICTGTFLLGDAGLLDGRSCTTHHEFVQRLRRHHPAAQVVENRLCVQDGRLWTSAGVAAGIDLALQLIAQSFGDHVALRVARENVVPLRRFGSDPALSVRFRWRDHGNQLVHAMQDEIANDLSRHWTGEALARKAGFSTRHLARLFKTETGVTMKRYQTELRMDLARRLVQGSTLSLEHIAERCGFGSMQAFRATWNKFEREPPSRRRRLAARDEGH